MTSIEKKIVRMSEIFKNVTDIKSNNTTDSEILILPGIVHCWAFLDVLLFCIIVSGNVLTILAVQMSRRLRNIISNYLILNLAISDLLVGLTLPYHLGFYFSDTLNKTETTCILRFVLIIFVCCASIFNVCAIAAERYLAIIYPFKHSTHMTRNVIFTIITIEWLCSVVIASVPVYWNNFDSTSGCELDIVLPKYYVGGVLTPIFVIIWLSILTLYIKIWEAANIHVKRLQINGVDQTGSKDRKNVQVVLLIVGCFSICWVPYLGVACTRAFDWYKKSTPVIYKVTFSLIMANSGMNPMIYAWKNSNFRKAFQRLLRFQSPNHDVYNSSLKHYLRKQSELSMKKKQNNSRMSQDTILRTIYDNRTFEGDMPFENTTL